jgi:hypothetical protein
MHNHRSISALTVASLIVVACGGGSSPTSGPSVVATDAGTPTSTSTAASPATSSLGASVTEAPLPSPTEAGAPTPAPTATPAAVGNAFPLAATVWFSGYQITLTGGTYDAAKHVLHVDGMFQNTSTQETELRQLGNDTTIRWNSEVLPAFVTPGVVPIGATVAGQVQVQTPADFALADAVLAFGKVTQHQALVPLGGAAATSEQPTTLALAGKVTMGKYVTYTITSAMLVPAACTGYTNRIRFGPLPVDQVSILIWGTAHSKDPLNYAQMDQAYLVLADGSKVQSIPGMSLSVPNGATIPNQGVCFAVPEPGSGTFTLKLHEYRSKATGSLQLVIP